MLAIKSILHPTDFSEPSECAFRLACSLASDYQAQLVIVHVIQLPIVFGEGLVASTTEPDDDLKEELFDLTVPDRRVKVVRHLEQGTPAAEILHLAKLSHADLIVMGTHGRRGINRLMMGSVAEEVLRAAQCPVLTVRVPVAKAKSSRAALIGEGLV